MTGKADFSPEEWEVALKGPPSAGMIVITAQRGGTFRESFSTAKAYAEARKEHGDSQLLDEIVSNGNPRSTTRYHSPEELKDHGLQNLRDAVELLAAKATPEEVDEYRRFVLTLANRVAEAHKGEQYVLWNQVRGSDKAINIGLGPGAAPGPGPTQGQRGGHPRRGRRAADPRPRRGRRHELAEVAGKLGLDPPSLPRRRWTRSAREALEARIQRLTRRRERLGPVNPLAKQEYDEALAHVEDLERSAATSKRRCTELQSLIQETDRRIRESFEQTFEAAAKNFEEVIAASLPGRPRPPAPGQPDGPRPVLGGERRRRRAGAAEAPTSRRSTRARPEPGRAGHRDRGHARRQDDEAAVAALGRREVTGRARLHVRRLPRPPVPLLHPRRGRGRARRPQHRPLPPAGPPLLRPRPVHRRHPPEAHDGGGRHALRREHGRRRHHADHLAQARATRAERQAERRAPPPSNHPPRPDWQELFDRRGDGAAAAARTRRARSPSAAASSGACARTSRRPARRSGASCGRPLRGRSTTRPGSASRRR